MLAKFPTTTREQINEMIEQDGRIVTFHVLMEKLPCPDCSLDPITDTSTDSFCPTCSGNYWLPVYSGWEIKAHVTNGTVDNKNWQTGGIIDDGTTSVKIIYSGEYLDMIYSSEWVDVDGVKFTYSNGNITLRGIPEINRIIISLKELEEG